MFTPLKILIGAVIFLLIIWLVSEIQIKVWMHRIKKHFDKDYKKFKKDEENGKEK